MLSDRTTEDFALFQVFPRMAEAAPRLRLGAWPTPITPAARFAEARGLKALFLKREDLSHGECGGNKVRGLEFVLADAQRRGARRLLTIGAAGSHHVCRTAFHARRLDMETQALVVPQPAAEYVSRNLAIGLGVGVEYVPASYASLGPKLAWRFMKAKCRSARERTMFIPSGGTSPSACLGHVNAALELKRQIDDGLLPEPDYLYCALGSLGTLAGLAVGCKLAGLQTRLVGVVVSFKWYCTAGRWARLANRTIRLMRRLDPSVPRLRVESDGLIVVGSALGRGYAQATPSSRRVADQFHECEGIRLDRTYTAKALDGAMQFIQANRIENRVHLFWHTYQELPAAENFNSASAPAFLRPYFENEE